MNDDVSKSYHCDELGCQMSFHTEQNLSAHRQVKHNKLNLEIPSKDVSINFSADQTPTPTRLLNKCEELKVFDDPYIQSLNPFDEGFRKAISDDQQSSNGGFLTKPSSNQDTLHTPQILPDYILKTVSRDGLLPIQDEPENLSTTPDIPKYTVNEHDHQRVNQPVPLLPKPNPVYTATTHLSSDSEKKSNESVKDKLKNILLNNSNSINGTKTEPSKRLKIDPDVKLNLPTILIQTAPLITPTNLIKTIKQDNSSLRVSDSDIKPLHSKKPERDTSTKSKKVTSTSDNNTTNSNPAALKVERNRAAARRYRHKMKIQSQALREKYEKSQKEIAQLKKEVTELKKLLLLHKDCEVTRKLNLMS